jgi:hypothetical protein
MLFACRRNARARNLNSKYFTSDSESGYGAPIPITKRKRGRPAKGKAKDEDAIGIMDGLGLEMSAGMAAWPHGCGTRHCVWLFWNKVPQKRAASRGE